MKKRIIILAFAIIFVMLIGVTEASAMNTGFSTEEMTEEDKNNFISNADISLITEAPPPQPITVFDVNDNGDIAVGHTQLGSKSTVCVYSNEGDFQYGYSFKTSGSFGVEWDEENLNIYFVRSSVIVSVSPIGETLDVRRVQDTTENSSYMRNFINATERTVGDAMYQMKNDWGIFNWIAFSYSKIAVTDAAGVESVIYDVSSTQLTNTIVIFGIGIVIASVIVLSVVRYWIDTKRR